MDAGTYEVFKKFLTQEVIKGTQKNVTLIISRTQQCITVCVGNRYGAKRVFGTKVVNITKLLCDLEFWMEVER